jgi:hypothetical protein
MSSPRQTPNDPRDLLSIYQIWETRWSKSGSLKNSIKRRVSRPPKPIYTGPFELDLRIAKQRVKTRQWHYDRLQKKFAKAAAHKSSL